MNLIIGQFIVVLRTIRPKM